MKRGFGGIPAAIALAVVSVLGGCGSSGTARAEPPAVITTAGARSVLSQYTVANNRSNQLRDAGALTAYEAGSSDQIDAGAYTFNRVADPANKNYAALTYVRPIFY